MSNNGEEENAGAVGPTKHLFVGNLAYSVNWRDLKDHMAAAGPVAFANVLFQFDGRSKGCGFVEYEKEEDALNAIETLNNTDLNGRSIFVREDRHPPGSRKRNDREGDEEQDGEDEDGFQSVSGNRERGEFRGEFKTRGRGARGGDRGGTRGTRGGASSRSYQNDQYQGNGESQLYVGNLPWSTQWQDLKEEFSKVGTVVRADILLQRNGQSKGSGLVLMSSPDEAEKAIETFNETEFQGRVIMVHADKFST